MLQPQFVRLQIEVDLGSSQNTLFLNYALDGTQFFVESSKPMSSLDIMYLTSILLCNVTGNQERVSSVLDTLFNLLSKTPYSPELTSDEEVNYFSSQPPISDEDLLKVAGYTKRQLGNSIREMHRQQLPQPDDIEFVLPGQAAPLFRSALEQLICQYQAKEIEPVHFLDARQYFQQRIIDLVKVRQYQQLLDFLALPPKDI